jgi:hypothetical protein
MDKRRQPPFLFFSSVLPNGKNYLLRSMGRAGGFKYLHMYWFWNHKHLGWVRGIELFFSLYFVVDALCCTIDQ